LTMTTSTKRSEVSSTPIRPLLHNPDIIHRLVRRSEYGEGDVETILQRDRNSLQLVIRDEQNVHEIMELEQDDFGQLDSSNRLCWATFEDMKCSTLCVLSSPTKVHVWDSTSFLGEGEGTSIHLPFEANAIFPLKTGILVQRNQVLQDQEQYDDEDMFVSSKPETSYDVASVFSLTHPIRTLLPVTNSLVVEKVLFLGIMEDRQLCITFNIELGRHSLFVLTDSPQITNPIPSPRQLKADASTTLIVEEDLLRENNSFYGGISSRQEALADALGVGSRLGNSSIYQATSSNAAGVTNLCPAFSMTLLYESILNDQIAKAIFLAGSYLCIHTSCGLHIWQLQDQTVTLVGNIKCRSAVPIEALPINLFPHIFGTDILIVDDNYIHLYRGGKFLAVVTTVWDDVVLYVRDPVGSRFTVELQSKQSWRVDLNLVLSPMAERALEVVAVCVPDELSLLIRLDAARLTSLLVLPLEQDTSWSALSLVLKKILIESNAVVPTTDCTGGQNRPPSAWDMLTKSGYHATQGDQFAILDTNSDRVQNTEEVSVENFTCRSCESLSQEPDPHSTRIRIFDAIHLLYEEFKLSMLTKSWCEELRILLMACLNENMNDFSVHYLGWTGDLDSIPREKKVHELRRLSSFAKPPCIFSWIRKCLIGQKESPDWLQSIVVESVCSRIKLLSRTYCMIKLSGSMSSDIENDIRIVERVIDSGFKDPLLLQDDFPIGAILPLLSVLARCRHHPCISELGMFSNDFWKLIGREDTCKVEGCINTDIAKVTGQNVRLQDADNDGLVGIENSFILRFSDDNRLKEVGRLLRSSRPCLVKVPRAVEVTDHDYERLKQERLLTLAQRTLALPVGRGMFSLGTLKPVPAEQLPLPELCLSGRVPPTNNSLALDMSNTHEDMTVWPEFHNGVAAGLRLPPKSNTTSAFRLSRSWIIYNKTANADGNNAENQTTHSHGGFLMALGLQGHLSVLSMTDVYEYLTQGSVTTSVGVLLGMAANRRGSCDPSVSKMLCLHIPSLLPPSFSSIDVAAPAHAAAVAGIGLLYQGSSHRLMTEFLLNEMGRKPMHDSSTVDREAYTISCGLALGMINLAKGGSGNNAGLADLDIEQRLYRYVVGGVDNRTKSRQQDIADRRLNGGVGSGTESERCARIYEGDSINHDVTAPGALLALGLTYLKSGNKTIAASLALPETHFLLEYARPDTLMLRVVARSLVLWDEVEPSHDWIKTQIPVVVQRSYKAMEARAKKVAAFTGLGPEENKKADERENDILNSNNQNMDLTSKDKEKHNQEPPADTNVDRQSIRQIHAYVLSGSCFSIGLRFSGTSDAGAAAAISKVLLLMKSFRDSNDPVSAALRPEQSIVGMCIGICAVSLALVMAGTGDLDTLRLFKIVRWRSDDEIRHGSHMSIACAIGILFLGGGMCTFGTSAEDIAALVAAFFPRYPMDSIDNKYHLQALRHLYALAVKRRHVRTFDVDSGEEVSVSIKIQFEDSTLQPAFLKTPGLIRNADSKVAKLVVESDVYFSSSRVVNEEADKGYNLFVKKRTGDEAQVGRSIGQTSLAMLLGNESRELEKSCVCTTTSEKFYCSNVIFGCVSAPLSTPTLHILSFLGSMKSNHKQSLAWDAVLLQCFYAKVRDQPHQDLIDQDCAALILEKAKRALSDTT